VQPNNDLAHPPAPFVPLRGTAGPSAGGRSAAAGPATSRGGFQPPKWLRYWQPSAASATRLAEAASSRHQPFQRHKPLKSAEDNSFSIIAHFWRLGSVVETKRAGFLAASQSVHRVVNRTRRVSSQGRSEAQVAKPLEGVGICC